MPDVPGNSTTGATIAVGGVIQNSIETVGDHDWYAITLTAGQQITIWVDVLTLVDPYVYIRSANGTILGENDDGASGLGSRLVFTAPSSGTYYIDVAAWMPTEPLEGYTGTGTYKLSVTNYVLPPIGSLDDFADQLTHGFYDGDVHHFDVTQGGTITVDFSAITTAGRIVALQALQQWSDILGINFVQQVGGAQITFDDLDQGTGAHADVVYANGIISSATVNVADYRINLHTYMHEIGHALGLGHTSNSNAGTALAAYPYDALYRNDGSAISIMSYFDNGENDYYANLGFSNVAIMTPQLADILAIGNLYGLSTTTRTGNTTYGFNNNSGRDAYDAVLNPNVSYTVFDSGGNDTLDYSGFSANQLINLTQGSFSNVGGLTGNVAIALGTVIENAIGGSGNDQLRGNSSANVLNGGTGADLMIGAGGNDSFYVDNVGDQVTEGANGGTDQIYSSINLYLSANVENLTLTGAAINGGGNASNNTIIGNAQNNVINGDVGADTMLGGAGDDSFYVDNAGDLVSEVANEGTDTVYSSVSFTLWTNVENLTLTGTAISGGGNNLDNIIIGNAQNNVINGDVGADTMLGGAGNDSFYVDNAGDVVSEIADNGTDTVYSSMSFTLWTDVENLTLTGTAVSGGGNNLDNIIIGNAEDNVINGDVGADTMLGGDGNDSFYVDNLGDAVSEIANQGTDTVYSSVSFNLWTNVENLTLTGTAISGGGNDLDNIIIGNAQDNVINGDVGADTMLGGAGDDSFYVDNVGDQVSEIADEGTDWVYSSVSFSLWSDVENLSLTGASAINGTGNAQNNLISGNGAANTINGAGGNDNLLGGAGADSFLFDSALNAATNVDQLTDFSVADDTIVLDDDIFAALSIGALGASAFRAGAVAADADDRIIYDSVTGNIYYDADGNGAGTAILFAQVAAGTALTNADFLIVG